jgi:geranylgeranyl pyrophosphate synthase
LQSTPAGDKIPVYMEYREIQFPVRKPLRQTERILKRSIDSRDRIICSLREGTPILKGKQVRPTFLFLLAGLLGMDDDGLPEIAAAIELLHLGSLVHDDVVDNSSLRRGEKSQNHNFGIPLSVLWGDFLFIHALNMIRHPRRPLVQDTLLKASRSMIEGQIVEYGNTFNYDLQPSVYNSIISKKTATLFSGIAEIAGHLHGDAAMTGRLVEFGRHFGIVFQISDDLLDVFSNRSGKERFLDLKEGKITLPYILLRSSHEGPIEWERLRGEPETLLELFNRHRVRERTLQVIGRHCRRCQVFLEDFPDSIQRRALAGLIDFLRCRDY